VDNSQKSEIEKVFFINGLASKNLRRGGRKSSPLNPPSFLGKRMEMVKRGVNSQPQIGTKKLWVGEQKKAVKFDWFWMKNKKSRFKDRRGINFMVSYRVGGGGWCFSSVASLEAI
jgi:hypothetical protein